MGWSGPRAGNRCGGRHVRTARPDEEKVMAGRTDRRVIAIVLMALSVSGCSWSSRESYAIPDLPADYRYTLTSSCGERALIGRYQVVVNDGAVSTAEPMDSDTPPPRLADVPTLEGIVEKANQAESDADVELELDDAGVPVSLSIDHDPDLIDDEECYDVTDFVPGD
jgi:uncharacterized protein DUF6174